MDHALKPWRSFLSYTKLFVLIVTCLALAFTDAPFSPSVLFEPDGTLAIPFPPLSVTSVFFSPVAVSSSCIASFPVDETQSTKICSFEICGRQRPSSKITASVSSATLASEHYIMLPALRNSSLAPVGSLWPDVDLRDSTTRQSSPPLPWPPPTSLCSSSPTQFGSLRTQAMTRH